MARGSEKPVVFSFLFNRRYNWTTGEFTPHSVTNDELQDAILTLRADEGISLAVANPANFLKDFLRSSNRNAQWPAELAEIGYTARQSYSDGRVFDFVLYSPGQVVPFPDDFELPSDAVLHPIETVSLPSAARALGRSDEAWLIQVCVHQRVLQTHFALFSDLDVVDFFHLQNNIKGKIEIDALFLMTFRVAAEVKKALITFEAKRDEPILQDQLREQVALMAKRSQTQQALHDIDYVIPVAASTSLRNGHRVIAVFEMEAVGVADGVAAHNSKTAHDLPLLITKSNGYYLVPSVTGI